MHTIWFEREVAPEFKNLIPDNITMLGSANATPNEPYAGLKTAQGVIASVHVYDEAVIAQAPNLLIISRTGIGYEKVDIATATERGIAVCNAPSGPTISTAEYAITLMLTVAKNIKPIEAELRNELKHGSKRHFYKDYHGIELAGKQLGLVGCGRIGSRVAAIAQAIGMTVVTYDPYLSTEQAQSLTIQQIPSLEALLQTSDVVSLHLPLTDDNQHFMNAERFAQMKSGAIFINTARGGHVDEKALLDAIDSGHLFGAGLDVTYPEPPDPDNPLLDRPNVIVSPHIASGTAEGKRRNFETALNQTLMVLRGERPPHLVNPEVWSKVLTRLENT